MNIVFFGTPDFSVDCLETLVKSGHHIVGVVAMPDKPQGRHLELKPFPVKEAALKNGLKLFQFEDVNSPESVSTLKALRPDLFVVVSFGKILGKDLITVPAKGAINIHTSYLPKYRGPAPIERAIYDGNEKTGVTIIFISEKLDAGDIIIQEEVNISANDNYETLSERLLSTGIKLMLESISLIQSQRAIPIPQDAARATYAPKFKKEEIFIDWKNSAKKINDLVRALYPKSCAHTYFKIHDKFEAVKILEAGLENGSPVFAKHGEVIKACKDGIFVQTGSGVVIIKKLQPPGKKPMDAGSFINGHKVQNGDFFNTTA